ncbi:hypothetical protein KP509_16G071700 [Ceratopteris richardii]|uniref:Uncharacterized protein n=1 Tax=Ceratopteris richardii TaxID=49495 RepID=A0A8T2T3G5_CERRI|nr:hypothetical protein KP509_16G071700 [Ceratopteris richardii]
MWSTTQPKQASRSHMHWGLLTYDHQCACNHTLAIESTQVLRIY